MRSCLKSPFAGLFVFALLLLLSVSVVTTQNVDAQTGPLLQAAYYLDYRLTPGTRVCIGQSLWLEAEVKLRPELVVDAVYNGLSVSPRRQNVSATAINVQVLAPGGTNEMFASQSLRWHFRFDAVTAGTTSIEIDATAQNPSPSPIPPAFHYRRSVRIDVIPCQLYVEANALWVTTVSEANAVFRAKFEAILSLDENASSAPGSTAIAVYKGQAGIEWDIAVNRFRGCLPGHNTSTPVPGSTDVSITVQIINPALMLDPRPNDLDLFLEFSPQSGVHIVETDCEGNVIQMAPLPRDWVYRDNTPHDQTSWFGWWQRIFSVTSQDLISFPPNGGTMVVPLILNTGQDASGPITITLTPVQ